MLSLILLAFPYFLRGRPRLAHPQFIRLYQILTILLLVIFMAYAGLMSLLQYSYWQQDVVLRYSLPPYTPLTNFYLGYTYHQHFKLVIWRLIGAIIVATLMWLLDRLFGQRLFYQEEYPLLLLLNLLLDFPLNIFFFITGLIGLLIFHFYSIIKAGKNRALTKVSFAKIWVYLVPIFILLNLELNQRAWFLKFRP